MEEVGASVVALTRAALISPRRGKQSNPKRPFAVLVTVALALSFPMPLVSAQTPQIVDEPPYDSGTISGSGTVDKNTGRLTGDGAFTASFTAKHSLAAPVYYIEYTLHLFVNNGNWTATGGSAGVTWDYPAQTSAHFSGTTASLVCSACQASASTTFRQWYSYGVGLSETYADTPGERTVSLLLRNPSGERIPAGPISVAAQISVSMEPARTGALFASVPSGTIESHLDATFTRIEGSLIDDPNYLPDLTITSLSYSPQNPTDEEWITFSAVVKNLGNQPTPATYAQAGSSSPAVPALNPGQSWTMVWRQGLPAGIQTVGASVDSYDSIVESNEENNQRSIQVVVTADTHFPDLLVEDVRVYPPEPNSGEWVMFEADLRNAGDDEAWDVETYLTLSGYPSDWRSWTDHFDPGEATTEIYGIWPSHEGTFSYGAATDTSPWDNEESNEYNNNRGESFAVGEFESSPRPVVYLEEHDTIYPRTAEPGESFLLHFMTWNLGRRDETFEFATSGSKAGWSVSVDAPGIIQSGDRRGAYVHVQAGESGTLDVVLTAFSQRDPSVSDSRTFRITVGTTPVPDLELVSLTIEPAQPIEGQPATVRAQVRNNGAAVGSTVTDFRVDGALYEQVATPPLGSGATTTLSVPWTPPFAGPYEWLAQADGQGALEESNTYNNYADMDIMVSEAPPPPPPPDAGVDLSPPSQSGSAPRGGTASYSVTITNTGSASDTFALTQSGSKSGWSSSLSTNSVTLAPGASTTVTLATTTGNNGSLTVTLTATSQNDTTVSDAATCRTSVQK